MKDILWSKNFILVCFSNFLMAFAFYLIGTTMPFYIAETFGVSDSVTGLVLASYIFATLLIRPFSGYIVDGFSRIKVYLLAYLFFIVVYFGYMVASSLLLFVFARMFHGLTWGVITTSSSTVAIDVIPSSRRGEGIGFFGLTSTLAMSVGPFVGLYLYDHFPFEYNFYSTIIFGCIGFAFAFFIKLPDRKPIIRPSLSFDRFLLKPAIPVGFNLLLIGIGYGALFTYAAKFGKQIGVENTGLFFLFTALGMTVTRLFAGRLLDKGYMQQLMIGALIIISSGFILFGFATEIVLFLISAFIIGFGFGMATPTFQTIFVNMAKNDQRGTANSTFFTFYDLGIGIGMILSGFIGNHFPNNFGVIFISSGVIAVVSILYYLLITKNIYEKRKVIEN